MCVLRYHNDASPSFDKRDSKLDAFHSSTDTRLIVSQPKENKIFNTDTRWLYMNAYIAIAWVCKIYLYIKRIIRRVCVILCSCLLFRILRISTGDYKMATHFRQSNYRKLKTLRISRENVLVCFVINRKEEVLKNDKKI